jgi:hypothetical protein
MAKKCKVMKHNGDFVMMVKCNDDEIYWGKNVMVMTCNGGEM